MRISQEDRWEQNFDALKQFIEQNKCMPSKHRVADHRMLNWLKYNRKLIAQGKLAPKRQEKLEQMLATFADYRKLNQYSYVSGKNARKKNDSQEELSLF